MTYRTLLSAQDVAQRLGIHRTTVHRRRRTGELVPVARTAGRFGAYLYDASEIEALVKEQKMTTSPAQTLTLDPFVLADLDPFESTEVPTWIETNLDHLSEILGSEYEVAEDSASEWTIRGTQYVIEWIDYNLLALPLNQWRTQIEEFELPLAGDESDQEIESLQAGIALGARWAWRLVTVALESGDE